MARAIVSGVLFQAAWLVCVLAGSPAIVLAYTAANLFVHLRFIAILPRESSWLLLVTGSGILLDTVAFQGGLLVNADGSSWPPGWLLCLWLNFAMALRYCFAFLQKNLLLAGALGAFAGPSSYFTGALLNGNVQLAQPLFLSLPILSLIWATLLPFLAYLARGYWFGKVSQHA